MYGVVYCTICCQSVVCAVWVHWLTVWFFILFAVLVVLRETGLDASPAYDPAFNVYVTAYQK